MGRNFSNFVIVNGKQVGFRLLKRGKFWQVKYPTTCGTDYFRMSTGQTVEANARQEAETIIRETYDPKPIPKPTEDAMTWDDVVEMLRRKLTCNNNRFETFKDYSKTISVIRQTLPETTGPDDIDAAKGKLFKERYITTCFKRSNKEGAKAYPRTPRTLAGYLRKAKAIWNEWLDREGANPWESVKMPVLDKHEPEAPNEEHVLAFLDWLKMTFKEWKLPELFVRTKAFLGCRLSDICSLESDQLRDGAIHFNAAQRKSRRPFVAELPADLFAELQAIKGKVFLWQSLAPSQKTWLKATGKRRGRAQDDFSISQMKFFVMRTFTRFSKAHPEKKLTTHDFRRRAVTIAFEEGLSVEMAAERVDMSVQTARLWYLDLARAAKRFDFTNIDKALAL